jgi:hypothetical protein
MICQVQPVLSRSYSPICERGLVLFHQNYFQHNILEAGAHWADSPWRSANNINNTGFPEPPPYAGDKRIFQAELFYDVTHPVRRQLHEGYIRQCLDNFKTNSNVIQFTSAEFTGPPAGSSGWIQLPGERKQVARSSPVSILVNPQNERARRPCHYPIIALSPRGRSRRHLADAKRSATVDGIDSLAHGQSEFARPLAKSRPRQLSHAVVERRESRHYGRRVSRQFRQAIVMISMPVGRGFAPAAQCRLCRADTNLLAAIPECCRQTPKMGAWSARQMLVYGGNG